MTTTNQVTAGESPDRSTINGCRAWVTLCSAGMCGANIQQHDWGIAMAWYEWLMAAVVIGVEGVVAGFVIFKFWLKPTPKMDRVAMLIGFAPFPYIALGILTIAVPKEWEYYAGWVVFFLAMVLHFKLFQEVERKWALEGKILPMPDGHQWPVIGLKWYGVGALFVLFSCVFYEAEVTGYDDEDYLNMEFWAFILPVALTWATLRGVKEWKQRRLVLGGNKGV